MSKLTGTVNIIDSTFTAIVDNVEVIINMETGHTVQKVYVPKLTINGTEYPIGKDNLNSIYEQVAPTRREYDLYKDEEGNFVFKKEYQSSIYPTETSLKDVSSFFTWYFHKYDIYNMNPIPF